jgi:hypothetical protein
MSGTRLRRLTGSRVGVAVSVGLIVFGIVDAAVPHRPLGAGPASVSPSGGQRPDGPAGITPTRELAAQQVAERFVTATHTTDPSHPAGDTATEMALAPQLVADRVAWPVAWTAEGRRTTVALDSPGQPLAEPGGQVAVIVTGTITVGSNSGPPTRVPLFERVTLRSSLGTPGAGDQVTSGWVVTDVEAGS